MTDWKTYKGSGPWDFTEQPTKWGYLNNPLWSSQQNAIDFCKKHGLPLNPDSHKPCGHWHRNPTEDAYISIGYDWWWQPSIDVYCNTIGMVPMRYDDDGARAGIIGMIYEGGIWKCRGIVHYMAPIYAEPNTCRLTSTYMAYYCPCWHWNWNIDPERHITHMAIYIFEAGKDPRTTDVWESNWGTFTPYYTAEYVYYNVMDCVDSRIACIALVVRIAGAVYNRYMIKVSNDSGYSFPTEWSFPIITSGSDRVQLKMSQDGIVWVMYIRRNLDMVELWKSDSDATNWTKVWENNFSADLNGYSAGWYAFDVSDMSGRYVTISLNGGIHLGIQYQVTYISSNYGANFTARRHWSSTYSMWVKYTSNGQYAVVGATRLSDSKGIFFRSDDYSNTFSDIITDPIVLNNFYTDQQKYDYEVVHAACRESYSPPAPSPNFQSVLYSDNNGLTWKVIQSPIPIIDMPTEQLVLLDGSIADVTDEPQVWPMP